MIIIIILFAIYNSISSVLIKRASDIDIFDTGERDRLCVCVVWYPPLLIEEVGTDDICRIMLCFAAAFLRHCYFVTT